MSESKESEDDKVLNWMRSGGRPKHLQVDLCGVTIMLRWSSVPRGSPPCRSVDIVQIKDPQAEEELLRLWETHGATIPLEEQERLQKIMYNERRKAGRAGRGEDGVGRHAWLHLR